MPFPPPGDLPDPEIEPTSLALAGGLFTPEPPGKTQMYFSIGVGEGFDLENCVKIGDKSVISDLLVVLSTCH